MSLDDHAQAALLELDQQGLLRQPREVRGPQRPRTSVDGRLVLNLCSNDYLGLSSHPALAAAIRRALDEEGTGAGASRHVSGNMLAHRRLEQAFADFTGYPAAAMFATGYAANVGTLQALVGRDDIIFSDALNHASLIDGARLSRAELVVYRHCDLDDLAHKLAAERARGRVALIVSESLFSMDGDVAPLAGLHALAQRYDAGLVLDESHALGVMGPQGRGLAEAAGVRPEVMIGTMGKAFGSQGALVAGSSAVVALIRNRARSFIFSTAPSPALSAAGLAGVKLGYEADALRASLRQRWMQLRSGLSELGFRVLPGDSAIVPVLIGEAGPTMELSRLLFERGVFVHGIRPPTVPRGQGRLRVVPMATHSEADIAEALAAFAEVRP